jgi:hypothetical protein
LIGIFLAASAAWVLTAALAQQKPADPKASAPAKVAPTAPAKAAPTAPAKQQQQSQQQQQASLPVSTEQALFLIRSTLLTLNDANRSGNYTVLRDLAAPDFQARNTAADLSQSFSDLRRGFAGATAHRSAGTRPARLPASCGLFSDSAAADQFRSFVSGRRQPVAAVRHFRGHARRAGSRAVMWARYKLFPGAAQHKVVRC